MKLFYSPFHDFVHKALVVAYEASVADDIERVPTFPFRDCAGKWVAGQYDVSALNPLGQVPFLTLDDGFVVYSSQVVVEYLDSLSPGVRLYPQEGPARVDALRRLSLGDSVFEFAVRMVTECWRDPDEQRADIFDWLWPKIIRSYDLLEKDSTSMTGFDIGHAGLLQGVSFVDMFAAGNEAVPGNPCIEWKTRWPALAEWLAKTVERPSVAWHYKKPYTGNMSADYHAAAVADVLARQAAHR